MPRTFAIGDVHGCLTALQTLLKSLSLKKSDSLIFLGDLVDRGPNSKEVIDLVLELRKSHDTEVLMGNHEQLLLDSRFDADLFTDWFPVGGKETLQSYGWTAETTDWVKLVPLTHWKFLEENLLDVLELEKHFCVHGNIDPALPFDQQDPVVTRWTRFDEPKPHPSGKKMITGHTHQKSGLPLDLGHSICIDTWVYGETGWLTALDLDTWKCVQANQKGETRNI